MDIDTFLFSLPADLTSCPGTPGAARPSAPYYRFQQGLPQVNQDFLRLREQVQRDDPVLPPERAVVPRYLRVEEVAITSVVVEGVPGERGAMHEEVEEPQEEDGDVLGLSDVVPPELGVLLRGTRPTPAAARALPRSASVVRGVAG